MTPRFLDAGECALVVEYGSTIDPALHDQVLALDAALAAAPLDGLIECVPTYRSLMVHYDPLRLKRADLVRHIAGLGLDQADGRSKRRWTIPACYDETLGEDLAFIAERQGLAVADVVRLHATARFRLYMFGFAPGVAYLGGGPPELAIPRRTAPRDMLPAGSLIIAGGQAVIMTVAMPSGWYIVGRTPERLFVADREPKVLGSPGDEVTFEPVDLATFHALAERSLAGEVVSRVSVVGEGRGR
jgi:KipI family sensor histidine kinase inhibitor